MGWFRNAVDIVAGVAPAAELAREAVEAAKAVKAHHREAAADDAATQEAEREADQGRVYAPADPGTVRAVMFANWQAGGEPSTPAEAYFHARWQEGADTAYRDAWEAQGGPPSEREQETMREETQAGMDPPDPADIDQTADWRSDHPEEAPDVMITPDQVDAAIWDGRGVEYRDGAVRVVSPHYHRTDIGPEAAEEWSARQAARDSDAREAGEAGWWSAAVAPDKAGQ